MSETTPQPKFDAGPWRVWENGAGVISDDFKHDVILKISGDFGDAGARRAYAEALAAKLNSGAEGANGMASSGGPDMPATPTEAEKLAVKAVGDYLTACRIANREDREAMGNYLMKLASVAGCLMANAEGADIAFNRLLGTAQFVLKTMPKAPAKLHLVQ